MRMVSPILNRSLSSDLFDDFDRLFDSFVTPSIYDERKFMPAMEVKETDENYLVSLDIPGMKKEDIQIEMNGNILTVSGERKRETNDSKARVQHFERSYGYFKRSFTLPNTVDAENVDASYENGVLQVWLPKTHKARARRIEVKSGQGGFLNKLLGKGKEKEKEATSEGAVDVQKKEH